MMIEQNKYYFYNIYLVCVEYKSGLWALYKTHEDYKFPNKFRQPKRVCRKKYEKKCCPWLDTYLSGSPIVQDGHIIGAVY